VCHRNMAWISLQRGNVLWAFKVYGNKDF
jgi:hypothetical protein